MPRRNRRMRPEMPELPAILAGFLADAEDPWLPPDAASVTQDPAEVLVLA